MVYKDLMGIITKILQDDKFKNNLKDEAEKSLFVCSDWLTLPVPNSVDPGNPESERKVSDMHTGLWMQRAQALVGGKKTAIGIVMYSDKTHALQGMQCYP
eukprot:2292625-Rhodomonas_salina.1